MEPSAWTVPRMSGRPFPWSCRREGGMTETHPRILVVDDDEDIRELLKIFLEADGYQVRLAADGLEAWQHLENGSGPALILLDLMMPRMDGEQFLRKIRCSNFAGTPVI